MIFTDVSPENRHRVDEIFAGEDARFWVHHNWYWEQNARTHPDIEFRLIEVEGVERPVGVIAFGQHYADEELTQPLPGVGEVIHTVIDVEFQRRGHGRRATLLAIEELHRRFERVVIAHNPQNEPARRLYADLGFRRIGTNYDGDPLLELMGSPLPRLREICLALPEAEERLSHGTPSWFAGKGRMFGAFANQHHGFPAPSFWFPAPAGAQAALIERSPERYFRPPYVGHRGWLAVDLGADVDWVELAGFIEEAYRLVATARLVKLLDAARG